MENFGNIGDLSYRELILLTSNVENTIKFLQHHGLLHKNKPCDKCKDEMKLTLDKKLADLYLWKCPKRNCQTKCSLKSGTFFEGKLYFYLFN